ncbi:MAG: hypothetical protein ABSA72_11710 [Nitrososphaerales archaeon]
MSPAPKPSEYLPRILGTRQPSARKVTELVVVGKDHVAALAMMLALFREHKVDLFGIESQSMPETKLFVISAYVGLESSDCTVETMLGLLRNLIAVQSADGTEMGISRYNRFLFPVVALDGTRLVITSTENLTDVEAAFSKLPEDTGNLVLFATGRQSGLALTRSLRRTHPGTSQQAMLIAAEDELRTSGWGLASFDLSAMERGAVTVGIREPIIANTGGAGDSWTTYGLCAGIIEGIFGMVGHVGERSYSKKTRQLKFKLVELMAGQSLQGIGI